jgi:hypothetical protein
MPDLKLLTNENRTTFSPGEIITGTASWRLDTRPEGVELNLVWSTRGKGTPDVGVVHTVPFADPQATDTRPFTITLPAAPYSFSGQLISLLWTLELNVNPGDQCEPLEIIIAPGGKEVLLPRIKA